MDESNYNDIFEVSLIGTGGGYGESIILNLGNNNWIVVDSCQDPNTKLSLPLEYLKLKNVNLSRDIKLIICTHWHNDHILGLSDLLEACESANFCMASATDRKKFLLMVGIDAKKVVSETSISSTSELSKCIDIVRQRKQNLVSAVQDRMIFSDNQNNIDSKIFTLSPSDFILEQFNYEISTLLSEYYSSNRKIVLESPNDKSVAILIKVNNINVILGSDLEVSNDSKKGWLCILDNCKCIDSKASIFKIPHHGSRNGFHERIWSEIIEDNAIAKLTPWNRGGGLPTKEMLTLYSTYTDNLYMTSYSSQKNPKPKKRDRTIAKAINRFNKTLNEERFSFGIISCKYNLISKNDDWAIELTNKAFKVNDEFIEKLS